MAGTTGSKYRVVDDELPVKSNKVKPRKGLKSMREVLKRKKKEKKSDSTYEEYGRLEPVRK